MLNKLLGEVKGVFNYITMVEIFVSLLYILIGLIFFSSPSLSNKIVSILVGSCFIIKAASSIYSFIKRDSIVLYNFNLYYGIIFAILGVCSFVFGNVLNILLGITFIIFGAQKINIGLLLKKFNEESWLMTLVIGVLALTMGIIGFFANGDNIIKVVGICVFTYGALNFVNILLLRKRSSYFLA